MIYFSEIQYHNIPTASFISTIQIFLESLFFGYGAEPVHTGYKNRLPLHLLGSVIFRYIHNIVSGSYRRYQKI